MFRAHIVVAFVYVSLSGCAHTTQRHNAPALSAVSVEEPPKFALALPTEPTISTVSSHVEPAFALQDERPETEKTHYTGVSNPHYWRDAVTILPMESFETDLEKLLQKRILKALANPADYDQVIFRISSFYVALDERERIRAELVSNVENWEAEQERLQGAKEQRRDLDSADDDFGDRVMRGLIKTTVVAPAETKKYRDDRAEQLREYPQSLPRNLTEKAGPGWNCNIEGDLILRVKGRPDRTMALTALSRLYKDDTKPVADQVQAVVYSAVADIQGQIERR